MPPLPDDPLNYAIYAALRDGSPAEWAIDHGLFGLLSSHCEVCRRALADYTRAADLDADPAADPARGPHPAPLPHAVAPLQPRRDGSPQDALRRVDRLADLPAAERASRVRRSPQLQFRAVAEELAARARTALQLAQSAEARGWALAAIQAARGVEKAPPAVELALATLEARQWAVLAATACRDGNPTAAHEALQQGHLLCTSHEIRDLLTLAELREALAALRDLEGKSEEAAKLLTSAHWLRRAAALEPQTPGAEEA